MEHFLEEITNQDKTTNKISVFNASSQTNIICICLPAMGVRASFYKTFASELAVSGNTVITADWRGQGHSSQTASYKIDFGYEHYVSDLDNIVQFCQQKFPNKKIVLVGHSLGGQIESLYISRFPQNCNTLVLIAASSVYHKGWTGNLARKIKIAGILFYPLSRLLGYFPGRIIGFGGREARTVMKDWTRNLKTGSYNLTNSTFDYDNALKEAKPKILCISFDNDHLTAPKQAVINLLNKFGNGAHKEHLHFTEDEIGIPNLNHFSWAKQPTPIVKLINEWIKK
ncbi:MAG TPA: alpha/beta fold hydrolase [Cyclobacteriaceae bacterium]|nr:alpha/beta fold hydrolase [Cyclobacteriaceae bacterium]